MQGQFKSSAERDVRSLKEAVEQYRDQLERLEMQKKLLLNQVGCLTWPARCEEGGGVNPKPPNPRTRWGA